MEIPRSFSSAKLSVTVEPLSTLPIFLIAPVWYNKCSVKVVLPASTCAKIPNVKNVRIFH